ncbi:MAG: hypothetical protein ABSG94_05885 [Brevinematales bacterium]
MRILIAAFAFVLTLTASAFSAEELPIMLGIDMSFIPRWSSVSLSNANTPYISVNNTSYNSLGFGLFCDFKYIRVDFGYQVNDTAPNSSSYSNGTQTYNVNDTNNYSVQNLSLQILGKYPIQIIDSISIWPAMGFEYNSVIFKGHDGTNELTNTYGNMNTAFIKIGAGADIKISENFYFEPMILFGWAMDDSSIYLYNMTASSYKIDFSFGAAYKF